MIGGLLFFSKQVNFDKKKFGRYSWNIFAHPANPLGNIHFFILWSCCLLSCQFYHWCQRYQQIYILRERCFPFPTFAKIFCHLHSRNSYAFINDLGKIIRPAFSQSQKYSTSSSKKAYILIIDIGKICRFTFSQSGALDNKTNQGIKESSMYWLSNGGSCPHKNNSDPCTGVCPTHLNKLDVYGLGYPIWYTPRTTLILVSNQPLLRRPCIHNACLCPLVTQLLSWQHWKTVPSDLVIVCMLVGMAALQ